MSFVREHPINLKGGGAMVFSGVKIYLFASQCSRKCFSAHFRDRKCVSIKFAERTIIAATPTSS